MNAFEAHAESLTQLQREETRDTGNQAAGTITFAGQTIPANVGPFTIQQVLRQDGGGYSPSLIGSIIVLKSDLPPGTDFHSGNRLSATPPLSDSRTCQIITIEDCYSFYILTVADMNQNV